jgi:hypothetical protein
MNNDGSSFIVFASFNVKYLVVESIDELLSFKLEDLPPVGVSAPDLHVS